MAKHLKRLLIVLTLLVVAVQFVRPAQTNPPVDPSRTIYAQLVVPADVRAVLEQTCGDCHSNQTRWAWYSNVAPASWFVASQVNEGRRHMNFSEWAEYDRDKARLLLNEIVIQVKAKGAMPPPWYVFLHPEEASRRGALIGWAETEKGRIAESRKGP